MRFETEIQQALESYDPEQQLRALRLVLKRLLPAYRKYVLAAAVALVRHEGFTTPAEQFVYNVLHEYAHNGPLISSDDVAPIVEELRESWSTVRTIVERFAPLLERQEAAA